MKRHRTSDARGFTLIELMVVILIILLVSAATLPVAVPAIMHRQVGEAALLLQAGLAGARDAAIRANAPRGIRLLSDPSFNSGVLFASNRYIPIEPAGDYTVGRVSIKNIPGFANSFTGGPPGALLDPPLALRVEEAPFDTTGVPNERTSWFWNIRVGDKIRFGDSGNYYTVVGPLFNSPYNPSSVVANPELFVNAGTGTGSFLGRPGDPSPLIQPYNGSNWNVEYLLLVNGFDDNQNGYTDEGMDGLDNNGNGLIDLYDYVAPPPSTYPLPATTYPEYEPEAFIGPQFVAGSFTDQPYTILRRPVPSQGAREVTLPGDVVIDMTTWNTTQERSRLPVDPASGYVDVMMMPSGQVIQTMGNANPAPPSTLPFYHFWLTERSDVVEPRVVQGVPYQLPMPKGTLNYPSINDPSPRFLQGDRRLVTLFTHTGQVTTNTIENFDGLNLGAPYVDAQLGLREEVK